MLAVIVTHADAQPVPRPHFRALTAAGRAHVDAIAARFERLCPDLIRDRGREVSIGAVLTSPAARCVESVIRFAGVLTRLTATSDVFVHGGLKEPSGRSLAGGDLASVLDGTDADVVLLCTHGDLAAALPAGTTLLEGVVDHQGSFIPRPVLVVVEYERGGRWDDAAVLYCEALDDRGTVVSLIDGQA